MVQWIRARPGRALFPLTLALLYLYSFPYFARIRSANELPRIYLTMAMVERGAFDIGDYPAAYQGTPDLSIYRGKYYANKAPGMSLFAVPGYLLVNLVGDPGDLKQLFFWLRLFGATLPSLLFLVLLWRTLGQLVRDRRLRQFVLLAYACGTMALPYGTVLVAHQLSAALIASAFCLILLWSRGRGTRWTLLGAGLAAGGAVFVDYQAAFIGPPLFIYLLARSRPRLKCAALFCTGAALPLAALLYYHWRCFGSPFSTGYQHLANPVFAAWTSRGFLGLEFPEWRRLIKLHFSADDGLFYYSPFLLLAAPGLYLMLRERVLRAEGLLCLGVLVFFGYFAAALVLISGWDVGPRYVIVALPFYLVPIAVLFDRLPKHPATLFVPAGMVLASLLTYLWVAAVFPHFPDNFSNPFFDLTLRFSLAHYLPYNLGWLLGLEGAYSLLPYALVALLLVAAALGGAVAGLRARLLLGAGALLVCFVLIGHNYRGLARREMVVPESFLPWMERIWEPRNAWMQPTALRRTIGPARGRVQRQR